MTIQSSESHLTSPSTTLLAAQTSSSMSTDYCKQLVSYDMRVVLRPSCAARGMLIHAKLHTHYVKSGGYSLSTIRSPVRLVVNTCYKRPSAARSHNTEHLRDDKRELISLCNNNINNQIS